MNITLALKHQQLDEHNAQLLRQELDRAEAEGIDIQPWLNQQHERHAQSTRRLKPPTREQLALREHAHEQRQRARTARNRARNAGAQTNSTLAPDELLQRQNGRCYLCNLPITDTYDIEHVIPLARGGEHTDANLAAAHPSCNGEKGSRIIAFDVATQKLRYIK